MNMQLLSVAEFYSEKFTPGSAEALDKAVSYGLPFSLFGFAVVFAVLAVIMFVVIAFGKVFGASQDKSKVKKKVEKKVEKMPEPKVNETPTPVVSTPVFDNGSVVAAIMAAISAFRGANGQSGAFRVVSFKKRK